MTRHAVILTSDDIPNLRQRLEDPERSRVLTSLVVERYCDRAGIAYPETIDSRLMDPNWGNPDDIAICLEWEHTDP